MPLYAQGAGATCRFRTTCQLNLAPIQLTDVRLEDGYYSATPHLVEETPAPPEEADPLIEKILTTVVGVAARVERIPDEVPRILRMNLGDPGRFADLAATLPRLWAALGLEEPAHRAVGGDRARGPPRLALHLVLQRSVEARVGRQRGARTDPLRAERDAGQGARAAG